MGHLSSGMLAAWPDAARLSATPKFWRWRSGRRGALRALEVGERRVPGGVVGAVHEAMPNVTADVVTQLDRSRNAGVLEVRGGPAFARRPRYLDAAIAAPHADAGARRRRSAGCGPASAAATRLHRRAIADFVLA